MSGFDAAAKNYDRSRTAMIPDFEALYGTAIDALDLALTDAPRLLDLGAGTGALSELAGNTYRHAEITLNDMSGPMLDQAKERFGHDPRYLFQRADMVRDDLGESYDAVISSLAIHHLEHDEKQRVFARVFEALRPGGQFINIDQFEARSPKLHDWLFARWLADARAAGALEEDLQAGMGRMRQYDRNAPMQDQIEWLEAAGFIEVDVLYRNYYWAVFHARKPG